MSLFDNEEVLTPEILKQHGFIKCGPDRYGYIRNLFDCITIFIRIDLSQYKAIVMTCGWGYKKTDSIDCKTIFDFNYVFNKYSKYSKINGEE